MSKLTLSLEPSLIFIGIGALFGMKVGMSMLLGLVLNYGILAPHLIESKIIHHPAPQMRAGDGAEMAADRLERDKRSQWFWRKRTSARS